MNSISSYIASEQENNLLKKESISEIPSVKESHVDHHFRSNAMEINFFSFDEEQAIKLYTLEGLFLCPAH